VHSKEAPRRDVTVYPLIFHPIFKPRIWGGRRLETRLNRPLPAGAMIGESWELADLEDDRSVVARGPDRGKTITQMLETWGDALIGRAQLAAGRFPLLIKFLDAREPLSVQVHPDEQTAQRMGGGTRLKNEAWYVVEADDDACIYRGLQTGVGLDGLRNAVEAGRVEQVLNRIPARKGHCYYLPSGTVHALGGGVLVAEVQTPSDTTFRIYDWNRVDGATGMPRPLHVDEALACVSTNPVPSEAERPQHVASVWTSVTHLIRCPSFLIDRVRMVAGAAQPIPTQEMAVWMVLDGRGSIRCEGLKEPVGFAPGDTVLLPAGLAHGLVETAENTMWLEVSVPIESSLAGVEHLRPEALREVQQPGSGMVSLGVPKPSGTE
jgi:mannose-6-phosphate isomerase